MRTRGLVVPALLFAVALTISGGALSAQHVRVGVGIGFGGGYYPGYYGPPPPLRYEYYTPPAPGPGYAYVPGYYYPYGSSYYWRTGYWAPRPFIGASWIAPRYYGGRYYRGYWGGHRR
jgi:hypothetical protein